MRESRLAPIRSGPEKKDDDAGGARQRTHLHLHLHLYLYLYLVERNTRDTF